MTTAAELRGYLRRSLPELATKPGTQKLLEKLTTASGGSVSPLASVSTTVTVADLAALPGGVTSQVFPMGSPLPPGATLVGVGCEWSTRFANPSDDLDQAAVTNDTVTELVAVLQQNGSFCISILIGGWVDRGGQQMELLLSAPNDLNTYVDNPTASIEVTIFYQILP